MNKIFKNAIKKIVKFFKINIFITKLLIFFDYDITKSKRKNKKIDFDRTLKFFLNEIPGSVKQKIIFDVGANTGQSVERFKMIFNDPVLHSFEPQRDVFKQLQKHYPSDENVILNNFGLADKIEEKNFYHVKHNAGKSSFHHYTIKDDIVDIGEYMNQNTESETLSLRTLDEYVNKYNINKIHLLKIDTQGFENKVLKGAQETLKKNLIDVIELEIQLGKMYEKTSSFNEIENLIYPYGYKLIAIWFDTYAYGSSSIIDNPRLEYEAIYVRKEFFDNYQPEIVKLDNGTTGLRFIYNHGKEKIIYNRAGRAW